MNRSRSKKSISGSKKEQEGEDSHSQKKKEVRDFLESSFRAHTRNCIEVDIGRLKKFFEANTEAAKVLLDALGHANPSNWKTWSCCYCKFLCAESEPLLEHIFKEHSANQFEDSVKVLMASALGCPPKWGENILHGCWKPIDVGTASLVTEGTPDWDVSLVSEDAERKELLESVRTLFRTLLERDYLHTCHVKATLDYAMARLPSAEILKKNGVDGNPTLCFRCLEAPQLENVRDFLSKLLSECNTWQRGKEESSSRDDDDTFLDPPDSNVSVVLDNSRSRILIYADNWFIPSNNGNDNVSYNLDSDAVISWLYDDPLAVEDAVKSWMLSVRTRTVRSALLMGKFKVKLAEWGKFHNRIVLLRRCGRALQNLVVIQSSEEEWKTESAPTIQRFKEILEEWKDHLPEDEKKVFAKTMGEFLEVAEIDSLSFSKALAMAKDNLNEKLHTSLGILQKTTSVNRWLKDRVGSVSVMDYLTIVIPMLKSFLRVKWEADAIGEALIKECEFTKAKPKSKSSKGHKKSR